MPTEHATPPYDWVPPGSSMNWVRVGEFGWHTLTLPTDLGEPVLAALRHTTGAVIQEDADHRLSWLIEPKAPAVEHLHERAEVTLSGDDGSFVFVPGLARTHLVWWRVSPTADRLLTPADQLAGAIATQCPEWAP
ncbi:hypothetical protein ACMA1D_30610 [Streptomyces sp. 796.1]|uniref:hypothetical protein n=1 Tax=Streptomyces sp. 796.1 TaxID=3163029 RepID=UPI0039C8D750